MKKLVVTVSGELPGDEFDKAAVLTQVRGPIQQLVAGLTEAGVAVSVHTKVFTAKGSSKRARPVKAAASAAVPDKTP